MEDVFTLFSVLFVVLYVWIDVVIVVVVHGVYFVVVTVVDSTSKRTRRKKHHNRGFVLDISCYYSSCGCYS